MGILAILAGCAPLFNTAPPLVSPATIGHQITLSDLRQDVQSYHVFYSAPVYNPSGILFIPRGSSDLAIPDRRWRKVEQREKLDDLIRRIRDRYWQYPRPRLRALLAPPLPQDGRRTFLGYLYSSASTSARPHPDAPGAFIIRFIPEQRKPEFYKRGELLGDD
jgi:hypothetical protein